MTAAIEQLRRIGADVWAPKNDIKLSEWVEREVRLSPEWEASPGRYNLEDNPFWREVIDAFMDPEVRQISVKKSTQVGGTLLLISCVLGLSELDPAPSMIVGPDELYTTELRDRTYATGEESPAVRDRVPPERIRNSRHIDLGTARYYLAWAGSAQRLRGRACKRVFRSEIDVYPAETPRGGDPIKASAERVKRFFDSTIYDESSPDGDPSQIADLYDAGHQAQWNVQCPHCREWQVLRFFVHKDGPMKGCGGIGGLADEHGNFYAPDAARKTAHYVCVKGCRIGQDEKNAMVRGGKWVAAGQTIDKHGNVHGDPERGRRHLSFHIWSIHSPTITLADLAVAYLEHRRDSRLRDFFQNWLGLRFETRKKLPEWHILGKRLESNYRRGTVPNAAWFLTAGIDVQLDGCWYVIRGWGDQATSWLIDNGYVRRYDADDADVEHMSHEDLNQFFRSDIRQLMDAVINRSFSTVDGLPNPMGKVKLRPRLVGIDSQHRTREVHAFVEGADERRVRAIRGDHKTKPQDRFRDTVVEKPHRGGPAYGSPRRVTNIFTPHYKEALFDKFMLPAEAPGSWNLYSGVVRDSADYLRQIINERPMDVIDRRTGRKKTQWKPRSEQYGNHGWDCEVYAFCMAEKLLEELGINWDASGWKRPAERTSNAAAIVPDQVAAMRYEQIMGG